MQTGLTLAGWSKKIREQSNQKVDIIAETQQLAMHVREHNDESKGKLVKPKVVRYPVIEVFGADKEFPVLPLTHNQIATKLGIPTKYYDRMLREQPDLLATNVNTWFKRGGAEKRMLRTLSGSARAFLSNRYQRIDNDRIAEAVLPIIGSLPGVRIVSCQVTDSRLYIHAVTPSLKGEVKKGDVIQGGVMVSNSEVGLGAIRASAFDLVLACLNGMVSSQAYRANHVGRQIEEVGEIEWSDSTKHLDDALIISKVKDMVTSAVDEVRFKERIRKMRGLADIEVTGDPAKAVEVLSQRVGASDEESRSILTHLIKGKDLSAWGLVNAVTSLAHKSKSYDRAVEIEAEGGRLLDLSRGEWTKVLEAA